MIDTPSSPAPKFVDWLRQPGRKRLDAGIIALEALAQRIPVATGKRRLDLAFTVGKRGRAPDADNLLKSLLDGLVRARLLLDDDAHGLQLGEIVVVRGPTKGTRIALTDL